MKKGEVYQGVVRRVDFPNLGVVETQAGKVIVKNTLPGQTISLQVNKVRKNKAEGRLLSVLALSKDEIAKTCASFGTCGGCVFLSMPYEKQLEMKEGQMKRLFAPVLGEEGLDAVWEGIKASPQNREYRNKMEFTFGDEYKDGPLALGMHKRGSFYDIANVDECQLVDADYRLLVQEVRAYFAKNQVPFYHRLRHTGYLRHLLVRKALHTGEILVALVTSSQDTFGGQAQTEDTAAVMQPEAQQGAQTEKELLEGFLKMLLSLEETGKLKGRFAGILHIVNDSLADVVQCDKMEILYGRDCFFETLLGLRFRVSTFSFFQTNSYGAEVLYSTVREYVKGLGQTYRTVFDLYCGTGTITQLLSPVADQVIGVEIVAEAVEAARENAAANGLLNCSFIAGDVLKVLDNIPQKPDLIVLDPPRDGVHPKALPKILNYGVSHILYIACKPTSLARDLEVFLQNGYAVERISAVDEFPQAAAAEVVCLLHKKDLSE